MNKIVRESDLTQAPAYTVTDRIADLLGCGPRAEATACMMNLDDHLLRDIGVSREDIADVTGFHRRP